MLAIDTNLVVRFLVGDHRAQAAKAKRLIADEDVFVSSTVVLETYQVLRSVYRYSSAQVSGAISAFAGLARVRLEEPTAVAQALAWVGAGLDFADALHLAKARDCEAFVTFDRLLAKQANRVRDISVRAP